MARTIQTSPHGKGRTFRRRDKLLSKVNLSTVQRGNVSHREKRGNITDRYLFVENKLLQTPQQSSYSVNLTLQITDKELNAGNVLVVEGIVGKGESTCLLCARQCITPGEEREYH